MISIRMIREVNSGPNEDDRIHITRVDNNIEVSYIDGNQMGKKTTQNIVLTHTALSTYIKNLGLMFLHDVEPFVQIQFNFPGFPCFLATRKSLKNEELQDTLMDIANMVSESWFADYSCSCNDFNDKFESHY